MRQHRTPFWRSTRYACQGIVIHFRRERNGRIQLAAAAGVFALGWLLNVDRWEWCVLTLAVAGVIVSEMFNTAFEVLVDLVSPQKNELAGIVKDIAAGAVLLAAIFSIVLGLFVFTPKLWALLP